MPHNQTRIQGWRHFFTRLLVKWELTPLRVTALYYVFGFSALYFSDVYLVQYFSDPLLSNLQAIKAVAEVVFSGALIFALTSGSRTPLEHTTEKLEHQREELDVLHRVLRHNLRNDLTVLYGYGEIFLESIEPETSAVTTEQYTQKIEDINHYINQADRIRRITEQNGNVHTYELPELFETLIENNEHVTESTDIAIEVNTRLRIEGNHMLPDAFDEIVTNAIIHNDAETSKITITATDEQAPIGTVMITIADNGPGIPEHVSEVFETADVDQLTHLDGMGLWFVYWTIANTDGEWSIESTAQGTTFRFAISKPLTIPDGGQMV